MASRVVDREAGCESERYGDRDPAIFYKTVDRRPKHGTGTLNF